MATRIVAELFIVRKGPKCGEHANLLFLHRASDIALANEMAAKGSECFELSVIAQVSKTKERGRGPAGHAYTVYATSDGKRYGVFADWSSKELN